MEFLEHIDSTAWMIAGWTILHFLWVGLLLGIVPILGRWLLRLATPQIRYLFALACLLTLSLAPFLIAAQVSRSLAASPAKFQATTTLSRFNQSDELPHGVDAHPVTTGIEAAAADTANLERPLASSSPGLTPVDRSPGELLSIVVSVLPAIWLLFAPVTFAVLALGLVGVERLRRGSTELKAGEIANCLEVIRKKLRMKRHVSIAICERLQLPVLVGILRPVILVPPAIASGWTVDRIELLIWHELAHVRRWDNLVNLIQRLLESVLFFHPVVWWTSHWVRYERECCCDDFVVRMTEQPNTYAVTLAKLALHADNRAATQQVVKSVCTSMAQKPVINRICRLTGRKEETMRVTRPTLAFVGFVLLAVLGFGLLQPTWGQSLAEEEPASANPRSEAEFGGDRNAAEQVPATIDAQQPEPKKSGSLQQEFDYILTGIKSDPSHPTVFVTDRSTGRTRELKLNEQLRIPSHEATIEVRRIRPQSVEFVIGGESGRQDISVLKPGESLLSFLDAVGFSGHLQWAQQVTLASDQTGILESVNVKQGDVVKAGQVLAALRDTEDLHSFDVPLQRAELQYEMAKAEFQRTQSVNERQPGAISQIEIKRLENALGLAKFEVQAAHIEMDLAHKRRERLKTVAPINGVVTRVLKNAGETVRPADPIVELVNTDRILATGYPEIWHSHASRLGDPIKLLVEIHRSKNFVETESFDGRVAYIDPTVDPVTGKVHITAEFENRDKLLRAGMNGLLFLLSADKTEP